MWAALTASTRLWASSTTMMLPARCSWSDSLLSCTPAVLCLPVCARIKCVSVNKLGRGSACLADLRLQAGILRDAGRGLGHGHVRAQQAALLAQKPPSDRCDCAQQA